MKGLIFFLLISITVYSQQKDSIQFSDIFEKNGNQKQLIVQYTSVAFWGQKWVRYRIIYKEKKNWVLVDHFVSPIKLFADSVVVNKKGNYSDIFQKLSLNERKLKSENEIIERCRRLTPMINNNGDSVISERNLDLEVDIDNQVLEYRINKKQGKVWQRSPALAMEICPESIERKTFFNLLEAIKNAH